VGILSANWERTGHSTDCGPCFGSSGNYLEYRQRGENCTLVFKQGAVQPVTLSRTKSLTDFKLTIKTTFNRPLDVVNDNFDVEIILDDFDGKKVQLPITITRIQFLDGKTLIAEQEEDLRLLGLGRKAETSVPVLLSLEDVEEERNVILKIHYSYNQIKATNTVELRTGTIEERFSDKVVFVRTQ